VLPDPVPAALRENLDCQEESLLFTANQLLGRDWSLGARYRLTQAVLNDNFPDVPVSPSAIDNRIIPSQRMKGVLQQVSLSAVYNNPCGDFWQFNAFAGYRFLQRRAEVTLGLLNIAGQNYNLNPLNLYNELPRSRTLVVRLQLSF
jgi:hypothetical protein